MKKIIIWVLLFACAGAIFWKLEDNRQRRADKTALSTIKRAFVPVETKSLRYENIDSPLEVDGIFMPAKEMFVISETQGRVLEVYKNKGEWVNEGEMIAKVDDELLRIELEATQANIAKLKKDRERLTNLIEGDAAPKNKIEDLDLGILSAEAKEKALKKQISNTSIKAPMTGTLGLRFIERGSVIGPGIQVAQMTNLEKLFLMVKVVESDILNIKKGQAVTVKPDVFPGKTLAGKVTNIGLRADNAFNYDVEIETPNTPDNALRAGMHAKAIFRSETSRNGLLLPRRAVQGSLQDAKVFVLADSVVTLRAVQLGANRGDQVEVRSGLKAGESVVVSGQIGLAEGTKVRVVNNF